MLKSNKIHRIIVITLLLMVSNNAWAESLTFSHAVLRLPPPVVGSSTAVYVDVYNSTNEEITIVDVSSSIANQSIMHGMNKSNGMMHMFAIKKLIIAPQKTVYFSLGQQHIMLMGLKRKLILGEEISIELTLDNGDKQNFLATVTDLR